MWASAHDVYLESRILSASPIELIRLLYQGCSQAVQDARRHLAAGNIAARSRSITKACEILIELTSSLDHQRGGEISQRLAQLYDYLERRLIEANIRQSDAPLAEVLGLLSTLGEAWDKLQENAPAAPAAPTPRPANQWAQPAPPEPVEAVTSNSWSF